MVLHDSNVALQQSDEDDVPWLGLVRRRRRMEETRLRARKLLKRLWVESLGAITGDAKLLMLAAALLPSRPPQDFHIIS